MREPQAKAIQLKDYQPPAFRVEAVDLDVDTRNDHALVRAKLQVRRSAPGPFVLDGDELELLSVSVDGKQPEHTLTSDELRVRDVPDAFTLETLTRIVPQKNSKLEGLYATKNGFVTQCEAQGFRRITWFVDRPDVMARYTTTIHADEGKYPVLLSNGNLVSSGKEPSGRHWAKFDDPYPKPSYLFALVAAKLEVLEA
ncbi:MAG: aminopeptidase N, partial [Pseudomonadota bacterium]|nr:aminopeptidase N [Pseudomonadota bacterium]